MATFQQHFDRILMTFQRKEGALKLRTRWKRVRSCNLVGKRFFDAGEYALGFFTILKAYRCKVYNPYAVALDGSNWFDEKMLVVRTDDNIIYRVPFAPWLKIETADDHKLISELYNAQPW